MQMVEVVAAVGRQTAIEMGVSWILHHWLTEHHTDCDWLINCAMKEEK